MIAPFLYYWQNKYRKAYFVKKLFAIFAMIIGLLVPVFTGIFFGAYVTFWNTLIICLVSALFLFWGVIVLFPRSKNLKWGWCLLLGILYYFVVIMVLGYFS